MKNFTWMFCLLALASCSKNNDAVINDAAPLNSYSDAQGTWINVDSTQWYLTKVYSGGMIHIKLNGATNADKITIRTSGDGVLTENSLSLDANKNFSTDVVNSFSVTSVPTGSFKSSTKLIAYKGSDVFTVTLNSGPLQY